MPTNRIVSSIILALWLLLIAVDLRADQVKPQVLRVFPHSVARSTILHLQPGDTVSVTADSKDEQFAVDLYVYNSDGELVGKDDEGSSSPTFNWSVAITGNYYILARNVRSGTGSIRISVNRGKAASSSQYPQYVIRKIFFATDRNSTASSDVNNHFGLEPDASGRLYFGQCSVSIPRDHRMGELEGPSIFRLEFREDPSKHVSLLSVDEEDQSTFFSRIATSVDHSERRELFVFVHGFNTTFSDAARRTAQMAYDLGYDGPAILYSWPSQGAISLIAYNRDEINSEVTVEHLEEFLKHLAATSGATTIHLIGHSMGNRPLGRAVKDLAMASPGTMPMFNQLVLMAPDMDASLFKQLARAILPAAARVTLYASSRDEALVASATFAGYPRAGQGGAHILVVPGIDTIDASAVDTNALGLFHQYYGDNKTILADVFQLLRNQAPQDRFGLQKKVIASGSYWVFRPGQ